MVVDLVIWGISAGQERNREAFAPSTTSSTTNLDLTKVLFILFICQSRTLSLEQANESTGSCSEGTYSLVPPIRRNT